MRFAVLESRGSCNTPHSTVHSIPCTPYGTPFCSVSTMYKPRKRTRSTAAKTSAVRVNHGDSQSILAGLPFNVRFPAFCSTLGPGSRSALHALHAWARAGLFQLRPACRRNSRAIVVRWVWVLFVFFRESRLQPFFITGANLAARLE